MVATVRTDVDGDGCGSWTFRTVGVSAVLCWEALVAVAADGCGDVPAGAASAVAGDGQWESADEFTVAKGGGSDDTS